jgi:predicted RecB family nuclease
MRIKKDPKLSKSRFLSGRQCHLRLWYACFNRDLASAVSPAQQALFDTGHEVGELATRLYPAGVLIREDHLHHEEAVQTTMKAIQDPNIKSIYEAAFLYDDVRIRVDILERLDSGQWNLIEVKSSTSVKDVHLPDVAIQYYVLTGSGLDINRAFLLLINKQYIYDGNNLDLENFFSSFDVTNQALALQSEIALGIVGQKAMLRAPHAPVIQPSRHCNSPYSCDFWDYCTKEMPEHWVLDLYGISQKKLDELTVMNIQDIREIPDSYYLTDLQERIQRCVHNNDEFISRRLHAQLTNVEYPVHFLDFETVNPAIPRYINTRPYQIIPFQWSDHILYKDGSFEHKEYLCDNDKDPREDFARTLLDALNKKGTIFIYTTYEKGIITRLAEHFPQFRNDLLLIPKRFKDLCAIVRNNFYQPGFHGSFSLKSVLPILVSDMDYENLAIQEGNQASFEFLRMIDPATTPVEKQRIKQALLEYCGYDTLAMVKIRDNLLERV